MPTKSINESLSDINARIRTIVALKQRDERDLSNAKDEIDKVTANITTHQQAVLLCQRCMDEQADMRKFVENLNTALLRAIFDPHYEFHLLPVMESNSINVKGFEVYVTGDDGMLSPKRHGAGVRSVCTLGFWMAANLFTGKRMNLEPFMLLDEHLIHLDQDKWQRLIYFLQDFCKDTDFQIGFITHGPGEWPYTIELQKSGKITKVRQYAESI